MKIENIKINTYGTLKQKEINLKNNINIIYGQNESGKSTLLNFIKNIFYGISKNKNGKEISDYEKYLPWNGGEFSGKIKYQLDDGNTYEIFRDFTKKNPKVFNGNFEEISQDFKIDKKEGCQILYDQTGVSKQTYISTIMSNQQEVILDKQSQNMLVQKVANLGGTGDDNISFQKALDKLNKRQVEEIGTNRTQDRPINLLQKRSKELEVVLKDEKMYFQNKQDIQERQEMIRNNFETEKQKNNLIQELKKIINEKNIESEKINLKNNIKNENQEKIENIKKIKEEKNKQKEKLEIIQEENKIKNKKENKIIWLCIAIAVIIINILNIFIKNRIINYLILSLIPITIISYIILKIKHKKNTSKNKNEINIQKEKIKEEITGLESQINLLQTQISETQEEIEKEKSALEKKINDQKQELKRKYASIYDVSLISITDNNKIEMELENSNKKIMNYRLQLNNIEYEENNISQEVEKIVAYKEEQEQVKEKLQILEEKNKCFEITKDLLEKAYEKMKNSVTPKFTENLSKIVQRISNEKYQKVSIHEEKGLIVELENGEYIPASLLSIGTIDQLYLALRLSMLNEISNEKMPIILDETFAYFDEERLKNILIFLSKQAKEHQIIILTCTKRERKILDDLELEYQWIEL